MTKPPKEQGEQLESQMDATHLRRETRTALELAIVALAPSELVDRLALVAGLLEALSELPHDSAMVIAQTNKLKVRARSSLEDWQRWYNVYLERKLARS
jgi:hypothetical protein